MKAVSARGALKARLFKTAVGSALAFFLCAQAFAAVNETAPVSPSSQSVRESVSAPSPQPSSQTRAAPNAPDPAAGPAPAPVKPDFNGAVLKLLKGTVLYGRVKNKAATGRDLKLKTPLEVEALVDFAHSRGMLTLKCVLSCSGVSLPAAAAVLLEAHTLDCGEEGTGLKGHADIAAYVEEPGIGGVRGTQITAGYKEGVPIYGYAIEPGPTVEITLQKEVSFKLLRQP